MAITDNQKVDYLWKKVGYGVSKTDSPEYKRAYNESISSPLLIRGDKVWQRSGEIPQVIPSSNSSIITIYKDGGANATIECAEDITSTDNRTWKTGLTDWIPPEFGSTYLVKVYVDDPSAAAPQTTGTQLVSAGSGNDDEWFFDYQSGVLHFIGSNLPTAIGSGVSNKVVYVSGARYTGSFGVGAAPGQTANVGNLSVSDTTISTVDPASDLILDAAGPGVISLAGNPLTNVGAPTLGTDAVNKDYVDNYFINFDDDRIVSGNTSVLATGSNVKVTINGVDHSYFSNIGYTIGNLSISNNTISSVDSGVIDISTTAAINLPVGNTSQRPAVAAAGDLRFNTTLQSAEIYDGNAWIKLSNNIESQIISPDGSSNNYTLDQDATTDSVILSLNGVVQSPASYSVVGNTLTFVETPQATDVIDVRFLATTVATRLASSTVPASASSAGTPGQISYDSSYIYVCVAQNTWIRSAFSSW